MYRSYRSAWVLALFAVGCGGSQSSTQSEASASLQNAPGLKCLDQAKLPRSVPPDAPAKMDLSHIVVRYAGLRGAESITRTREEACLRAQEVRDKLLGGGDWEALYTAYSDSKDAMNGAFRSVTQDNLEKDFGNAAFSLKVDELSQVVETENGFHVIWRMK